MRKIILSAPLLLLLLAATDPASIARESYNGCLKKYANEQLNAQMNVSDFRKEVLTVCTAERDAMIAAITKDEMKFGSKQAEAAKYATEEADGVVSTYLDGFVDFAGSNSRFGG